MAYMFEGCESLKSLYLSIFNTENTTNMICMFKRMQIIKNFEWYV